MIMMLSGKPCAHPDCQAPAVWECECCKESTVFCDDHGSLGGDREGDENSLCVAVPNACWKCGGFNADA